MKRYSAELLEIPDIFLEASYVFFENNKVICYKTISK